MKELQPTADRTTDGIAKASAYFAALNSQGIAPVDVNDPRGDVFLDVTIEGLRFQALRLREAETGAS